MTESSVPHCIPTEHHGKSDLLYTFLIAASEAGLRLDRYLTGHFPDHSRSSLNKLIGSALVRVNAQTVKAGYRLREGDSVCIEFPELKDEPLVAEKIDFPVLFEDEHLLVISKPPGLVVHPACGHSSGTLVHGLLHHCNELPSLDGDRPGIVHRLDKDTSGIMLVAKDELCLRGLMADFKDRRIHKTYQALLLRSPREHQGRIVQPLGRHPADRKKMAVRPTDGKYAASNWQIVELFANGWCRAEIGIETGRTHQIRVHMAWLKAPVLGDRLYGGGVGPFCEVQVPRQMLHASTLQFVHPVHGEELFFCAPLWDDMQQLLDTLRQAP